MPCTEVELPGGLRFESGWRRDAAIRPFSGHDEVFLLDEGGTLSGAVRTTAVLARCVTRLGPVGEVSPEHIRQLSVGDREALLLHLRRLTLGDTMSCLLKCPTPECEQEMELDLSVSELLLPVYGNATDLHETQVEVGEFRYRVRFRLPNGADQEAVAALAKDAPEAAAQRLLQRCVHDVVREDSETPIAVIPTVVADALSAKMAELDPQAEIVLELLCTECGNQFLAPLDTADFFCHEISARKRGLYHEVHLLAFYYHWSEDGILSLTRSKRRLYLDMLGSTLKEDRNFE